MAGQPRRNLVPAITHDLTVAANRDAVQPKEQDPRHRTTLHENQLSEVHVFGQNDPLFCSGLLSNLGVRGAGQRFGRPDHVLSLAAEPLHNLLIHMFIGQQFQARLSLTNSV